jgi:2-polyprenyl-3-methyl-5-hydroxy-6-metoxy-1,4-benzoquinol methylase
MLHKYPPALVDAASAPFAAAGRFFQRFAAGKLRYDPLYFGLLRRGLIPHQARVLDLGCGQGILLSLLCVAHEQSQLGRWPQAWPAAPHELKLQGIELRRKNVEVARLALGARVRVELQDLQHATLPQSSVILLFDVLHYLEARVQLQLLERSVRALEPGGRLLLREADSNGSARFAITRAAERIAAAMRGHVQQRFHYRSAEQWQALLAQLGLEVRAEPMSEGTPFSNTLLIAQRGG